MCYFLTIGVPEQYSEQASDKLKRGYVVSKSRNSSLNEYVPDDHSLFYVTTGMCSCDLFQVPKDGVKEIEKIRKKYQKPKYKKRGWSKVKIERAVKDQIKAMKHGSNGLSPALRHELVDIVGLTKSLSIIVHWYSGSVDDESISLKSESEISTYDLINDDLAVAEDTLITLKL
jgi:hypothetical protein